MIEKHSPMNDITRWMEVRKFYHGGIRLSPSELTNQLSLTKSRRNKPYMLPDIMKMLNLQHHLWKPLLCKLNVNSFRPLSQFPFMRIFRAKGAKWYLNEANGSKISFYRKTNQEHFGKKRGAEMIWGQSIWVMIRTNQV